MNRTEDCKKNATHDVTALRAGENRGRRRWDSSPGTFTVDGPGKCPLLGTITRRVARNG